MLVDLLLHWKYEERPRLKVRFRFACDSCLIDLQAFLLILEFLVGIAIGYM